MTLLSTSCIEPYIAEIEEETKILSVEGCIIKGDSIQMVTVSKTATLVYPQVSYVEGCDVRVIDDLSNEFVFQDIEDGKYSLAIPDGSLVYGREYKLHIVTPDGNVFESEYEKLNRNSEVDSVYYEIEERMRMYTDFDYWGLQFYVDIEAPDSTSKYYRWKLTESYEYTSTGFLSYILMIVDDKLVKYEPDDIWELYRCWMIDRVPGTFVTNTINLTVNEKKRIPLHFVSNRTERLKIMYSLLVEQYAISEGAYKYWKQHNVAIEESSGLYNSQPGQAISNMYCSGDCEKRVLGYFWVASRTERRIFVPRINNLVVYDFACPIYEYDPGEHRKMPRYIRVTEESFGSVPGGTRMTGHPGCFDCTMRGGSITKPDFWESAYVSTK